MFLTLANAIVNRDSIPSNITDLLHPIDAIINQQEKIVLRNQKRQALQNDFHQY